MTEPATVKPTARPRPKPTKFKVRKVVAGMDTHPVLFADESETAVNRYITQNHPRGAEVYKEAPDGTRTHYSADHAHQGDDGWLPYEDQEED